MVKAPFRRSRMDEWTKSVLVDTRRLMGNPKENGDYDAALEN